MSYSRSSQLQYDKGVTVLSEAFPGILEEV
jgi:hypothetical protein